MIWFVIFSFVKLFFLKHKGYPHTTHMHALTHMLQTLMHARVYVWVFRSACGCVSVCVLYSHAQMVRILLCLYKATIINSQTLELNHKYLEILLLTWCPVLCVTLSDLDNQHVKYLEILRTFSTDSMQSSASLSQLPELLPLILP